MDTAPEILKQKIICRCCKNINTIIVKSQNKTEKKLIINMNPVMHITTKQIVNNNNDNYINDNYINDIINMNNNLKSFIISQNKPRHQLKTIKSKI